MHVVVKAVRLIWEVLVVMALCKISTFEALRAGPEMGMRSRGLLRSRSVLYSQKDGKLDLLCRETMLVFPSATCTNTAAAV